MSKFQIGQLSKHLSMSIDTLRYYEKIGLLPRVARNSAGLRIYDEKDISRLKFIQRAQRMNFTLTEISHLLEMRDNPQSVRTEVRALTHKKLLEVEEHLDELVTLRNELQLLINLCKGTVDGCPIIEDINQGN